MSLQETLKLARNYTEELSFLASDIAYRGKFPRRWISIFFIEVGCTIEKDREKGHLKLNLRKEFVNLLLSPCRKIFLEVREGLDVRVLNARDYYLWRHHGEQEPDEFDVNMQASSSGAHT
ncbi:hypothetical protein MTR_2g048845 [Medicago truncatula]|uniref:Uncharacterized protein n=1 Tax=Medicago truncatula TaxID=3880 RepID=A0A072V877_MEDTR|nr:hypothetical protein MTR_2g048845 [Medicago truncatula]